MKEEIKKNKDQKLIEWQNEINKMKMYTPKLFHAFFIIVVLIITFRLKTAF